jgi:hypothetical protein
MMIREDKAALQSRQDRQSACARKQKYPDIFGTFA